MKFLEDFNKYLNNTDRKSNGINKFDNHSETSESLDPPSGNGEENLDAINEDFNANLIEFKIIIADVTKDQVQANYAIFYNGKEFTKGQTILRRVSEGNLDYYGSSYKLAKPEYPITGTFDIHVAIKEAKKGAQIVAKIGQTAANATGIFNTKLSERNIPVPIKPFVLDLGSYFAPNVDTVDETKKSELNTKLADFEKYFNENKDSLRAVGAPVTFNIIGGASQVTTTYAGGNQKLAEARANNLKTYMVQYFAQSNPDLSKYISQVADVTTVVGQTPYVKGQDNPQDPKFLAEQFVKLSITATTKK